MQWWDWFFFLQADKPERASHANPDAWYAGDADTMGSQNYRDFRSAIHDPATVYGMLEDYRADYPIDQYYDLDDRHAGRRLQCPLLVIWSNKDDLEVLFGNILDICKPWARQLEGRAIDCGHHIAKEAPVALACQLMSFLPVTTTEDLTMRLALHPFD